MTIVDPWNGQAGETTWDIAGLVIDELAGGATHDRRTITDRLVVRHNAHPGTVKNVIQELARFGAIDRPGDDVRPDKYRSLPLWWRLLLGEGERFAHLTNAPAGGQGCVRYEAGSRLAGRVPSCCSSWIFPVA